MGRVQPQLPAGRPRPRTPGPTSSPTCSAACAGSPPTSSTTASTRPSWPCSASRPAASSPSWSARSAPPSTARAQVLDDDNPPVAVKAVAAWSPPTQLAGLTTPSDGDTPPDCARQHRLHRVLAAPPRQGVHRLPGRELPADLRRGVAGRPRRARRPVPIWWSNGTNELVPLIQAQELDRALTTAHVDHTLDVIPGSGHADQDESKVWNDMMTWLARQARRAHATPDQLRGRSLLLSPVVVISVIIGLALLIGLLAIALRDDEGDSDDPAVPVRSRRSRRQPVVGVGRRPGGHRSVAPGSGERCAPSTPPAPPASSSGRRGHVVRLERLPRAGPPPRPRGGRRRPPSSDGARDRARPAWWSAHARCTTTSSGRWPTGAAPRPRSCCRRASPPTWRCSPPSATATRGSSPTSSTTRRSSTEPGWPAPMSPSTATPTPTTSTALLDQAARDGVERTIVVTDTVFSMDGDVAPLAAVARRAVAPTDRCSCVDEAHAVLGPSLADHDTRRCRARAGRHDVEDARIARRVRRRLAAPHRAVGQPGAPLHLHHGSDASRHRRGAGGRRARAARPRATRSGPACDATSSGCVPAIPRRSCPVVVGDEDDAVRLATDLRRARDPRPGDPAAHGAARHLAAAHRPVGRPHR